MDPDPCPAPRSKKEIFILIKECVERLNHPRKTFKPPKLPRIVGTMSADRIAVLSVPRYKYIKPSRNPQCWEYKLKHPVKPGALTYSASSRIIEMATPSPRQVYIKPANNPYCWEYILKHKVSPKALKYIASEKIIELSRVMKNKRTRKYRKRRPRSTISKKALKAKASKRVLGLSKPQKRKDPEENEFAFTVNPRALHYKITPRLKRLAQPKPLITKVKERFNSRKKR